MSESNVDGKSTIGNWKSTMIQMMTSLEVADNSGARRVEMIMGIGGSTGAIASLGDRIKVTVKEASPDGTIKKGTVQDAVIVRTGVGINLAIQDAVAAANILA